MRKLLVVDGSNLLFQMFYGMPSRIRNKEGKLVHGTLGFVGSLLKMLKMIQPTHAVVLFDGEHENPRAALDEAYKANRPDFSEMPEEEIPFSQLPDVYAALDYLQIQRAETVVCEVDDWVAGYALRYGKEVQIVISSFDSDFFQLITPSISVLRYRGDRSRLCDEEYVRNEYGVAPKEYAEWKALVGDGADNVKGIRGVGAKTAAKLLNRYGNLENLLVNVKDVEKSSLREVLIEGEARLWKNLQLIRLQGCEELPFEMDELVYVDKGVKTGEVLRAIGL